MEQAGPNLVDDRVPVGAHDIRALEARVVAHHRIAMGGSHWRWNAGCYPGTVRRWGRLDDHPGGRRLAETILRLPTRLRCLFVLRFEVESSMPPSTRERVGCSSTWPRRSRPDGAGTRSHWTGEHRVGPAPGLGLCSHKPTLHLRQSHPPDRHQGVSLRWSSVVVRPDRAPWLTAMHTRTLTDPANTVDAILSGAKRPIPRSACLRTDGAGILWSEDPPKLTMGRPR